MVKCPTGIAGVDTITFGGIPRGRTTLVCGGAGCGKTIFAMEFICHGASRFDERGIFVSFEQKPDDLRMDFANLRMDLDSLIEAGSVRLIGIAIDKDELVETGHFTLDAMLLRLDSAIRSSGAKRIVLDSIEVLYQMLSAETLRLEIGRLFQWLVKRGLTVVITAERSGESLTRSGLEAFISDCVFLLDHRVVDQLSTRRLRVVKYRGSEHGHNEYPFLLSRDGMQVLPITAMKLEYPMSEERVSTGLPDLDAMLEGRGWYKGSAVLLTGPSGSCKTTLAMSFVQASCKAGLKALYFAFEESYDQVARNLRPIGVDLGDAIAKDQLIFQAVRPSEQGLEQHLLRMQNLIDDHEPDVVVIDPVTNLVTVASIMEVRGMMTRLLDMFKTRGITTLLTNLDSRAYDDAGHTVGISSLVDVLLHLQMERVDERQRLLLSVVKARGIDHSRMRHELVCQDGRMKLKPLHVANAQL